MTSEKGIQGVISDFQNWLHIHLVWRVFKTIEILQKFSFIQSGAWLGKSGFFSTPHVILMYSRVCEPTTENVTTGSGTEGGCEVEQSGLPHYTASGSTNGYAVCVNGAPWSTAPDKQLCCPIDHWYAPSLSWEDQQIVTQVLNAATCPFPTALFLVTQVSQFPNFKFLREKFNISSSFFFFQADGKSHLLLTSLRMRCPWARWLPQSIMDVETHSPGLELWA